MKPMQQHGEGKLEEEEDPPYIFGYSMRHILERVAFLLNLALYLSLLPSVQEMERDKGLGEKQPLPYVSLWVGCVLNFAYGFLIGEPVIIISQIFGVSLSSYYLSEYYKFRNTDDNKKTQFSIMFKGGCGLLLVGGVLSLVFGSEQLGSLCAAVGIIVGSVPALGFVEVCKSGKTDALGSPEMAVANFLCSFVWLVLGYEYIKKPTIWIPSLVGLVVNLIALILFATVERQKVTRRWRAVGRQTVRTAKGLLKEGRVPDKQEFIDAVKLEIAIDDPFYGAVTGSNPVAGEVAQPQQKSEDYVSHPNTTANTTPTRASGSPRTGNTTIDHSPLETLHDCASSVYGDGDPLVLTHTGPALDCAEPEGEELHSD